MYPPAGPPAAWAGEASSVAPGGGAEAEPGEDEGQASLADHMAQSTVPTHTLSDYEDEGFTGNGPHSRTAVEQGEYYQYHSDGEVTPRGRGDEMTTSMSRHRPQGRPRAWQHTGCTLILGRGPHGDGLPRPMELRGRGTTPKPFAFEERQRRRPKPIMQVKLEQDLALKAEADHIERTRKPFRAREIPRSTLEPRLERMLEANEYRRHVRHDEYRRWLMESDAPFSCYHRSTQSMANKARAREGAKRANPFYKPFKANPIPRSTLEARYHLQFAGDARREEIRKQRAFETLANAAMPPRMEAWASGLHEGQGKGRGAGHKGGGMGPPRYATSPVTPQPLGYTPDFNTLHQDWHSKLQRARENNRKRLTVPQEFQLNGGDPEVRRLRKERSEARKQRILLDIELDNQELTEQRWPWASTRAKVRPTAPPAFAPESQNKVHTTKAAELRVEATRRAKKEGHYQLRADKEAMDADKQRKEAARRAKAWLKTQGRMHGNDFATGDFGMDGSDPLASAAPAGRAGYDNKNEDSLRALGAPKHYVDARHKQAEEQAKAEVEQTLLATGAYEAYVEG